MSTVLKGPEKEFLIRALHNEQLDVQCMLNRTEYSLKIDKIGDKANRHELFFKSASSIKELKAGKKLDINAYYKGLDFVFVVEVVKVLEDGFYTPFPQMLYRNQDRSHQRVAFPEDIKVKFAFLKESYLLPISDNTKTYTPETLPNSSALDEKAIIGKLAEWVKQEGHEYKLALFKDAKPTTLEEQIITKTGKALFLPSSHGKIPETDPDPQEKIITTDIFSHYLEEIHVLPSYFDVAMKRFIKSKEVKNIQADAWIPLRFKEYVAGYIHLWSTKDEEEPLSYEVVKTLYKYADTIVNSLQKRGYFANFNLKDKFISVYGEDISVEGIRFSYTHPFVSAILKPDTELSMRLITENRTVKLKATVIRRYEEKGTYYFGCHFFDTEPEDVRFLYEYIYGKPYAQPSS